MFSYEFIQWRWKLAAQRETIVFGNDTVSRPGHSYVLFRAYSQPKTLHGWGGGRRGASTAVLFAVCGLLHLFERWHASLSPLCLPCREQTAIRWVGWRWHRGAGWREAVPAKGNESPSSEPCAPPQTKKSTDMVSWDPNLPTWCPHQQGLQSSNAYWEFTFASVRLKDTFLDPHVNYTNTPTFFSVPEHRRGMMIVFD